MQLNNLGNLTVATILAAQGENNDVGGTNYDDAFRAASELLDNPIDSDRFTIMISDGEHRTDRAFSDNSALLESRQARFTNAIYPRSPMHFSFS